MKSPEQATVERVRKRLQADPARMARLNVEWNKVADLLAPYFIAAKLKSFEAHHLLEKVRVTMLIAIDNGVPDRVLWIHAMHAAGCPAAPYPGRKKKP